MQIQENPFYILGATPRDNRRRIAELADEKALLNSAAGEARSTLTTPSRRLWAELCWFPDTPDATVNAIVTNHALLRGDPLPEDASVASYSISGMVQLNERRFLADAIADTEYAERAETDDGLQAISELIWKISSIFEQLRVLQSFQNLHCKRAQI